MATKLFLRNAASDYSPGDRVPDLTSGAAVVSTCRLLSTAAGAASTASAATATTGSPGGGVDLQATSPSGGRLYWYSLPFDADATISGSITWNIWAQESSMNANAAINGQLEVVDGATGNVTVIDKTARVTELGFSGANTVQNFSETPAAGVACKRGDRLRVRIFAAGAGTMAGGFTYQIAYDGPTGGADGDTWLQLTEDLTFVSEPAGTTIYPTNTSSAVTGGSAASLLSSFTGSDEDPLSQGGNWATLNSSNSPLRLVSNQAAAAATPSTTSGSYWTPANFGPDVEAYVTLATVASSNVLAVRVQGEGGAATWDGYAVYGGSSFPLRLLRYTNGASSATLGTVSAVTPVSGDSIGIACHGDTIEAWHKPSGGAWSKVATGTDTTYQSAGKIALLSPNATATMRVDDLYAATTIGGTFAGSGGQTTREAWTSRGAGVQTDVTNTAAGPSSGIQVTDTAGGTVVDWFTRPLTSFTLGGAVRVNARAAVNASADASIRCEIARVAGDGTGATVWGVATFATDTGITTSQAAYSFLVGGDDLAITDGQRLRVRFYVDDADILDAGQTVTTYYAGTSGGASGDTFLTFTQTLEESTPNKTALPTPAALVLSGVVPTVYLTTNTLFFGSGQGDYTTGNNDAKLNGTTSGWTPTRLYGSRGQSALQIITNTVTGPTNGIEAGGTFPTVWYSEPLAVDTTIAGPITWNLRASESNAAANVAINSRVEVIDGATGAITLIHQTTRTTEIGTTESANNFSETPAAGVLCKKGDRLRIRIFGDDAGTMATGNTFTFWYDGTTAGGSGDSYLTFTENLAFAREPAGTQVFLTDTASPVATAAVDREAWTTPGSGELTDVRNTAAGWTAPLQMTDTAGGTVVDWFTRPLQALTLGGAVRCSLYPYQSATTANATVGVEIARVEADGTSPTVWAKGVLPGELLTGPFIEDFLVSGDDLAVSDGQRLRIRIFADDSDQNAMATGNTVTVHYGAPSVGTGYAYLTFSQSLVEGPTVGNKLMLRNLASDYSTGNNDANLRGTASTWNPRALNFVQGSGGAQVLASNPTVTGPTPGLEVTAGTPDNYVWYTDPLGADVTIAGAITFNLWAGENNNGANVAINARLEVVDGATGARTLIHQTVRTTEVGTSVSANNFAETPAAGVLCKRGDRLRFVVVGDDAGTMSSGFLWSFYCEGGVGALGDSYFTLTENLTFDPEPAGTTIYPTNTAGPTVGSISLLTAFTGSDETPLSDGGNWATLDTTGIGVDRVSNAAKRNAAGFGQSYWTGSNFGPDLEMYVTLSTLTGSGAVLHWRVQDAGGSATWDGYRLQVYGGSSNGLQLSVCTNGSSVATPTLTIDQTHTWASGDKMGVKVSGSLIQIYRWPSGGSAWALVAHVTDSTYLNAGKIGIGILGTTDVLDDLYVGSAATFAPVVSREAWTDRGGGVQDDVTNTVTGPAPPIQSTDTAGGTAVEWYTKPLLAFTLGGSVRCNVRARASNTFPPDTDATIAVEVARVNADGTSATVWATGGRSLLLTPTEVAQSFLISGDDLAVGDGQRLRVRVLTDDSPFLPMPGGSNSVTTYYGGTSGGASGDTWLTFRQTLTEASPAQTPQPTAAAMTLTGATPSVIVTAPQTALPTAAAMTLTGATPAVGSGLVTKLPTAAALVLTGATPAVSAPALSLPTAGAMTLTGSVPAVLTPRLSLPTVGALVLTGATPAVVATANQTTLPTAAALVLTGAVPAVVAGGGQTALPTAAAMALTGVIPAVTATANMSSQPTAAGMTLSGAVPAVVAANNVVALPTVAAMVLSGAVPAVTAGGGAIALPTAASLVMEGYSPEVVNSGDAVTVGSIAIMIGGGL